MTGDPFVLVDLERRWVFDFLAHTCRPFRAARTATDGTGAAWAWVEVGGSAVGLTWLGPGWIWAAEDAGRGDELRARQEEMSRATPSRHRAEFEKALVKVRFGGIAGRLLWVLHQAVIAQKSSLITMADARLAEAVWGRAGSGRPRHWRSGLADVLRGLTWLHIAENSTNDSPPVFDASTVLLNHVGDLKGGAEDRCPGNCGSRGAVQHHHFQIDIGPGFLGVLESFGRDADGTGVRTYRFPADGRRSANVPSLRAAGKSGRLVTAFVPALLGEPSRCEAFTPGARRILQALVRETTRPPKGGEGADARAEVASGGRVRAYSGRGTRACSLLSDDEEYVGFNGNGKRKGMGYRPAGDWGWPVRAGYPAESAADFLDDLTALAAALGLTVVGVGPPSAFYRLDRLRGMAASEAGRRALGRIDVRVFAPAGYAERWCEHFGWDVGPCDAGDGAALFSLLSAMTAQKVSGRALARGIDTDPSFLSRVLNGEKPAPVGLLKKARAFLAGGTDPGTKSLVAAGQKRKQVGRSEQAPPAHRSRASSHGRSRITGGR